MSINRLAAACIFPIALAASGGAYANVLYMVTLDTSAISGGLGYGLAFSFQDGEGVGDNNNTVTLGNFVFGGGSAAGGGVPVNGASGSLGTSVILHDSSFSNLFTEGFTPGSSLSFKVDLTTNLDAGGVPDFFGFSILSEGSAIPTLDDLLADNFLYFNIDSANPTPAPWGTDPARSDVTIAAPTVALAPPEPPPGQVPEPGSLLLIGAGLAGLVGMRRRQG